MDQWQGIFLGVVSLVVAALAGRWARRWFDRRAALRRMRSAPPGSRQVRRALERKRKR